MNLKEQQEQFDLIIEEVKQTMFRKGNDYSNTDRLSNFKLAGGIIGLSAQQNCLSLIATKVARLGVLLQGAEPNNESIEDSMLDLTCYSILLRMIQSEVAEKPNKFTKEENF